MAQTTVAQHAQPLGLLLLLCLLAHQAPSVAPQTIATVAGNSSAVFNAPVKDGVAISAAVFASPVGVAVNYVTGDIYVTDSYVSRVRLLSATTGLVTTVVGTGAASGYNGDNQLATAASLYNPTDLAVHPTTGDLYITDMLNFRVRQVSAASKKISTLVGTGLNKYGGDGKAANLATLSQPYAVALNPVGDVVYIAELGSCRIRKVQGGTITTFAGVGCNNNNLPQSGDGGLASAASFSNPSALVVGPTGDVYIADSGPGHRVIRLVTLSTLKISTITGQGGELNSPYGLALSKAGVLFISDQQQCFVRQLSGGVLTVVVGNGTCGRASSSPSPLQTALFFPWGLAIDRDGSLLLADDGNGLVRRITFTSPPPAPGPPPSHPPQPPPSPATSPPPKKPPAPPPKPPTPPPILHSRPPSPPPSPKPPAPPPKKSSPPPSVLPKQSPSPPPRSPPPKPPTPPPFPPPILHFRPPSPPPSPKPPPKPTPSPAPKLSSSPPPIKITSSPPPSKLSSSPPPSKLSSIPPPSKLSSSPPPITLTSSPPPVKLPSSLPPTQLNSPPPPSKLSTSPPPPPPSPPPKPPSPPPPPPPHLPHFPHFPLFPQYPPLVAPPTPPPAPKPPPPPPATFAPPPAMPPPPPTPPPASPSPPPPSPPPPTPPPFTPPTPPPFTPPTPPPTVPPPMAPPAGDLGNSLTGGSCLAVGQYLVSSQYRCTLNFTTKYDAYGFLAVSLIGGYPNGLQAYSALNATLCLAANGSLTLSPTINDKNPTYSYGGTGTPPYRLVLLDTCDLVVLDSTNTTQWAANTTVPEPPPPLPPFPPSPPSPPSPPPAPPSPGDYYGDTLGLGQCLKDQVYLLSTHHSCTLKYLDGWKQGYVNIVRNYNNLAGWSLDTFSNKQLCLQSTGKITYQDLNNQQQVLASGGTRLVMQDDCNLVFFSAGGAAIWATNTTIYAPPSPPPQTPSTSAGEPITSVTPCTSAADCTANTQVCAAADAGHSGVCVALDSCTKQTYDLGPGQLPSACPANSTSSGGACYPTCQTGYKNAGATCAQTCPAFLTDTGLLCQDVVSTYSKGCCCTQGGTCCGCIAGFTDLGCSCSRDRTFQKASYSNGVATPMVCPSTLQGAGGLCFAPCRSGFSTLSGVCSQACSGRMQYSDGAYCTAASGAGAITASAALPCPEPMPL